MKTISDFKPEWRIKLEKNEKYKEEQTYLKQLYANCKTFEELGKFVKENFKEFHWCSACPSAELSQAIFGWVWYDDREKGEVHIPAERSLLEFMSAGYSALDWITYENIRGTESKNGEEPLYYVTDKCNEHRFRHNKQKLLKYWRDAYETRQIIHVPYTPIEGHYPIRFTKETSFEDAMIITVAKYLDELKAYVGEFKTASGETLIIDPRRVLDKRSSAEIMFDEFILVSEHNFQKSVQEFQKTLLKEQKERAQKRAKDREEYSECKDLASKKKKVRDIMFHFGIKDYESICEYLYSSLDGLSYEEQQKVIANTPEMAIIDNYARACRYFEFTQKAVVPFKDDLKNGFTYLHQLPEGENECFLNEAEQAAKHLAIAKEIEVREGFAPPTPKLIYPIQFADHVTFDIAKAMITVLYVSMDEGVQGEFKGVTIDPARIMFNRPEQKIQDVSFDTLVAEQSGGNRELNPASDKSAGKKKNPR